MHAATLSKKVRIKLEKHHQHLIPLDFKGFQTSLTFYPTLKCHKLAFRFSINGCKNTRLFQKKKRK